MEKVVEEKLKPVREVEPGWWKLRWRPIKHRDGCNGNWNFFSRKVYFEGRGGFGIGLNVEYHPWWNYGSSYKCLSIAWQFGSRMYEFWIKWDYVC